MNLADEWRRMCDENAELRAEIERLRAELDEEEKTVFAAIKMLKERDAEIKQLVRTSADLATENERLRAVLKRIRDLPGYQPLDVARAIADDALSSAETVPELRSREEAAKEYQWPSEGEGW